MNGKREFGDYQTPLEFAEKIVAFLKEEKKIKPSVILEPTCGAGNFLEACLSFNALQYWGIEVNPLYCRKCRDHFSNKKITIFNEDFFHFDFTPLRQTDTDILIIGNPPWVTNSTLSLLESNNLPEKSNFKNIRGIDAITGAGNFDIAESIILRLIDNFRDSETTIAMLCKNIVARNVFQEINRRSIHHEYCELREFDAKKVFGISASACLFLLKLTPKKIQNNLCRVFSPGDAKKPSSLVKYIDNQYCQNVLTPTEDFDGTCCFQWRQGIKHDCASIMEFSYNGDILCNKKGESADIEDALLYPLVKSSMFKTPLISSFSKFVLVTQKKTGESTDSIQRKFPKTWDYLNKYKEYFDQRKSSIYKKAPAFSMFGIGEYSFAPYKVGLSGFYKKPFFSVLHSEQKEAVMLDDTCYFIGFERFSSAYTAMLLLNSSPVQNYLLNRTFLDAKRPFTQKVLNRLSFKKVFQSLSLGELQKTENLLNLKQFITQDMYDEFQRLPVFQQSRQLQFTYT